MERVVEAAVGCGLAMFFIGLLGLILGVPVKQEPCVCRCEAASFQASETRTDRHATTKDAKDLAPLEWTEDLWGVAGRKQQAAVAWREGYVDACMLTLGTAWEDIDEQDCRRYARQAWYARHGWGP